MITYFHLIGIGVVIALIFLHVCIRYSRYGRLINEIPGPKPLPLFGNMLSFNIPTKKIWIKMRELQAKHPICKFWGCFSAIVLTRDPDLIKILLSSKTNINKDIDGYNSVKHCTDGGLLVFNGKQWEERRKMLNRAFSIKVIEIYSESLNKRAKKFMKELLSQDKTMIRDVSKVFMKVAFQVTCEAAMDLDLDTITEEMGDDFRNAIIEFGHIMYQRVAYPYLKNWMMKFLPIGRRQKELWKYMKEFAKKVINERRRYHENLGFKVFKDHINNAEKDVHDDVKARRKNLSVLDILLLNEQKGLIDSAGVVEETIIMISAGFETTGIAMTFLIILLGENQKAQDLAREELLTVMDGYNNEITTEHVKKLEYLDRCAKESMRLFTVTPFIGRGIDEEVQLGKYTIPVGTEVYMNLFDLHRDPNLWQDPLKFDPDRFLPENIKQQHPFAYVPFSRGQRNCIGQNLAMNEVKTIVAYILYNFQLESIDRSYDFEFDLGITIQVDRALVRFTKLEKNILNL